MNIGAASGQFLAEAAGAMNQNKPINELSKSENQKKQSRQTLYAFQGPAAGEADMIMDIEQMKQSADQSVRFLSGTVAMNYSNES